MPNIINLKHQPKADPPLAGNNQQAGASVGTRHGAFMQKRKRLLAFLKQRWYVPTAVFIVVISVLVLSFTLFKQESETTKAAWFNDDWHYRQQFDVFNASTTEDLTDFQVKIATSTLGLQTAYNANKTKSDFTDLRFTDASGNLLDYWYPDATSTMRAVYVKFPSFPKNATSTLFMYYGNPSAVDIRDGNKVFPHFFEDFSDGDITTGEHIWTENNGARSVTGSAKYIEASSPGSMAAPTDMQSGVWEFDIYKGDDNNTTITGLYYTVIDGAGGDGYPAEFLSTETVVLYKRSSGSSAAFMVSAANYINNNQWYNYRIDRSPGNTFTIYLDDSLVDLTGGYGTNPRTDSTPKSGGKYIAFYTGSGDRFDNIIYRKYIETDPIISGTAGTSEEVGGGPIAYWKFDEGYGTTAYDSSGQGNNGTLTNMSTSGTSTVWVDGKINGALMFDGTDDYVSVADSESLQLSTAFSFSLWFKRNGNLSSPNVIFEKDVKYYISISTINKPRIYLASPTLDLSSDRPITDLGEWHHFAGTYDGSKVSIYIDGVKTASVNFSFDVAQSSGILSIGRRSYNSANDRYFKGVLDELKIYNYAISEAQIKAEYNSGQSVYFGSDESNKTEGLVGYWPMDEATTTWDGVGDQVNDLSGNGYHGTSVGDAHATSTAKYGNAGEFDGSGDDGVNMGNVLNFGKKDFTLSAWIKTSVDLSLNTQYTIVAKKTGGAAGAATLGASLNVRGSSYNGLLFRISGLNTFVAITPESDIRDEVADGSWHFIVATADRDGQGVLYFDGAKIGSADITSVNENLDNSNNFKIGNSQLDSTPFNGLIDEVKVYNIVRTPDQIMQDYLEGPGPIAYWNFEEGSGTNLYDKSGQGNHSLSFGGGLGEDQDWLPGKYGRALDFDGVDDYINFGNLGLPNSSQTISAWVKQDEGTRGYILSSRDGSSGGLSLFTTSNVFEGVIGVNEQDGSNTVVNDGTWHHLVLIYDKPLGEMVYYLDGKNDGGDSSLSGNWDSTKDTYIGNRVDGLSSTNFDGLIDELKIYNYALSPWQVAQEYNGGKPVAYWKFDEGYGATVYDSSGNSNNGTLNNMSTSGTSTVWVTGKVGKALMFDGVNDYVDTGDDFSELVGNDVSISSWIKSDNSFSEERIFNFGYSSNNTALGIGVSKSADNTVFVQYRKSSASVYLESSTLVNNGWHLVTAVQSGDNIYLYVDGVLENQDSGIDLLSFSLADTAKIGKHFDDGLNYNFSGLIDEVKVYNYALSPTQIKKDYNENKSAVLGVTDGGRQIQQGLIGYWPMDEATSTWDGTGDRVNDYSGGNNYGTASGDAHATTTAKYGNAAAFDGTGDYITVANESNFDFDIDTPFTISAWIRSNVTGSHGHVFFKGSGTTVSSLFFRWNSDNKMRLNFSNASGQILTVLSNTTLSADTWYFVTATYDGSANKKGAKIYINGVLNAQGSDSLISGSILSDASPIIGSAGLSEYLNGYLDDVKVYNEVRTAKQIMQDYLDGPEPIAYWDFEEGSGTNLYDKSGHGNDSVSFNGGLGSKDSWAKGKFGRALNFQRNNSQYINFNDLDTLDMDTMDFSISIWTKTTHDISSDRMGVIAKTNSSGGSNTLQWSLVIRSAFNGIGLRYNDGDGSQVEVVPSSDLSDFITDGNWHHTVVTVDRYGTDFIYVDGEQVGSVTDTIENTISNPYTLLIGSWNETSDWFDGFIDELKIYNYALSPWQVAQEYNGGKPVAYWKFDEGEGGTVYDWSGNGNHGSLNLNGSPATSTAWQASTNCILNRCISLDGSNDYVLIPNNSILDTSNVSVSLWIKVSSLADGKVLFAKGINSADRSYWFYEQTSGIKFYIDSTYSYQIPASEITDGNWHLLTGTFDGFYINIYLDGEIKGMPVSASPASSSANIAINAYADGNYQSSSKLIDEVKIYNYALSPIQVKNEYNLGYSTYFK